MDIYDFCGRLDIWNISMGWDEDSESFPFGGEFVLWWAEVNSFGYHWFCKPFWLVIWGEVILLDSTWWCYILMQLLPWKLFWISLRAGEMFGWTRRFPPFCVFWDWVFWYSPPDDEETQLSHLMTRDRFSIRWSVESAGVWRGGDIQNTVLGIFPGFLGDLNVLVSRFETIYEDRFYLKLWNPKLTSKVWESSFRNEAVCQSCGFKVFTRC